MMAMSRFMSRVITSTSRAIFHKTCASKPCDFLKLQFPQLCSAKKLHTSFPLLGPGADYKYQSQEDREKKAKAGKKKQNVLLAGLVAGAIAGGLYGYYGYKKKQKVQSISNDSQVKEFLLDSPPPKFPPARIISAGDTQGLKITLFQYQTCPFCCKARVFLDYFGFSYDVIEVNSVMRTQVKWSKYKKVPIVVAQYGDKVIQVNDSSVIISALYSLLVDSGDSSLEQVMDCYPTIRYMEEGVEKAEIQNKYFLMYNNSNVSRTKQDIVEERRWRRWVDDELVHTLSPNVYRTPGEALEAFHWFDKVGGWAELFSTWERYLVIYLGATVMWGLGKKLKKRHNLKEDVRQSFYDQCNHWLKGISKKGTPFMGGEQPNLSDLAVFGVLTAIEGCEAFSDARKETKIGTWFDNMKKVVADREGKILLEQ